MLISLLSVINNTIILQYGYVAIPNQDQTVTVKLPISYKSEYSVANCYYRTAHENYTVYINGNKTVSQFNLHVYGFTTGSWWITIGF